MRAGLPFTFFFCCAAMLPALAAAASLFEYTDERGTVHYSNVPTDPRYEPVMTADDATSASGAGLQSILQKSSAYSRIILSAALDSRLEPELVQAVMVAESGAEPKAISGKGARGLMQLMPATAQKYGVRDVFDPEQNIRAGAHYLRDLADRYQNDLQLMLAAYNAGPAAVDRQGGRVPPFKETLDYVPRVLGIYRQLRESLQAP